MGEYLFHPVSQTLMRHGTEQLLSNRESEVLKLLVSNQNHVVETQSILLSLWGDDSYFNTKSLHVFITKLRRRLEHDPTIKIINIRGIGYKLIF